MSLPTPGEELFKKYEQNVFNFIWGWKPDKIKRAYLYNDYKHCGLKLLNLKALNFALKASLIPKCILNPQWFSAK